MAERIERGPTLQTSDVAKMLGVSNKSVSRWARDGKLRAFLTPGGHRRFFRKDVEALIREENVHNA